MLYKFGELSPTETCVTLASRIKRRRLERGMSRASLSRACGVPAPTLAKFEATGQISLISAIAVAQALGYGDEISALFAQPKYDTLEQLQIITKNKNRVRGR